MLTIISYDIPDDRRRGKMAKAMENFGKRVQYSVFEAWLEPPRLQMMHEKIAQLINTDQDSVRIYRLCRSCEKEMRLIGQSPTTKPDETIVI